MGEGRVEVNVLLDTNVLVYHVAGDHAATKYLDETIARPGEQSRAYNDEYTRFQRNPGPSHYQSPQMDAYISHLFHLNSQGSLGSFK